MEESTLSSLDPRIQKQVEKASAAIDKGNPGYAVEVCINILKQVPGCLEVREILRRAQMRQAGSQKEQPAFLKKLNSFSFSLGSAGKIKKDPAKVMEAAEEALTKSPTNAAAHKMLGQAATALGLHKTAVFAYNTIKGLEPEDIENLKSLCASLIEVGDAKEAIRIADIVLRKAPADGEGQELMKRASVALSMNKGNWDEGSDFRSNLKDSEEATQLEQAARAMTDEEGIQLLIKKSEERIEQEPDNINNYRDLAGNYRKLGDLEKAIEWVQKARKLESGKSDVALERYEAQLYREAFAHSIESFEEALATDPDNAEYKEQLAQIQKEQHDFLIAHAASMVQRYPNDYAYRYEYGALLLEEGKVDESIKQFQLAQRSPKVRIPALMALGRAYKEKSFFDLAAEQLSSAKEELPQMNDLKKEVIYELANCYEMMGDMDKAMTEYKVVYAADISYRDVAEKIEQFYSRERG
jgi:tetratricopeptide (TPR) repeat protein